MRLAILSRDRGLLQTNGTFSWKNTDWGDETTWLTEDRDLALQKWQDVEQETGGYALIVDHDFHHSVCYYEGQGWYDWSKREYVA